MYNLKKEYKVENVEHEDEEARNIFDLMNSSEPEEDDKNKKVKKSCVGNFF